GRVPWNDYRNLRTGLRESSSCIPQGRSGGSLVTVRRMSAHSMRILAIPTGAATKRLNNHARCWTGTSSPKAEVVSSNLAGRAKFRRLRIIALGAVSRSAHEQVCLMHDVGELS